MCPVITKLWQFNQQNHTVHLNCCDCYALTIFKCDFNHSYLVFVSHKQVIWFCMPLCNVAFVFCLVFMIILFCALISQITLLKGIVAIITFLFQFKRSFNYSQKLRLSWKYSFKPVFYLWQFSINETQTQTETLAIATHVLNYNYTCCF